MTALNVGYARVSTVDQDLTAERDPLTALGVDPKRIYVDRGLTGTHRARPGLREALAVCRTRDALVVTMLDRLGRSVPDAGDVVEELFPVTRSPIYRAVARAAGRTTAATSVKR